MTMVKNGTVEFRIDAVPVLMLCSLQVMSTNGRAMLKIPRNRKERQRSRNGTRALVMRVMTNSVIIATVRRIALREIGPNS